jgi:arylsulfatase A-like enzyme
VEVAALHLLKNYPVEVFAAYFHLVDVASHFVSSGFDPRLRHMAREEERRLGHVAPETRTALDTASSRRLEPIYAYADKIVGEFLDNMKPDSTLIVCSDHGFNFQNGGYSHVMSREVPHGILLIKGPGVRRHHEIRAAHIYDIVPTLLYDLGLPVAQDMDGKVLADIFEQGELGRKPVTFIKTYEDGKRRTSSKLNPATKEKLLEELRALGYIK